MKTILFTLIAYFSIVVVGAQSFNLSGNLLDADNLPLIGANILLLQDGEMKYQAASDTEGSYLIENINKGKYRLKVSYVGFFSVNKDLEIADNVNYETLKLFPSAVGLDEVVVKGKVPLATQKGDTTSYNASQYKVLADASTEDLVAKMPGVVLENGKIQAEGEDVQQVLVDGKPFFGGDATAALKNLPAEIVSKIEIFDQKSEQAQFSGFDDGETTKTINIVTKVDKRNGQFGKAYAALGTEAHYNFGGNFSIFNGDRRVSFIGQSNDINIQNFSSEDILGVSGSTGRRRRGGGGGGGARGGGSDGFQVAQSPGIARTNALGINFSDQWGEKLESNFSYFVNQSSNLSQESLNRAFFNREGAESGENYVETNETLTDNINHRFNGRFQYEISKFTGIDFRPQVSYQSNNGQVGSAGNTALDADFLNATVNEYQALSRGWNINNRLLFRHRFGESKRTISINFTNSYNNTNATSSLYSLNQFFQPILNEEEVDQIASLDQNGWNNSANVSFTNPVGEKGSLAIEYRITLENEDSNKETFNSLEEGIYDQLDEALSNVFKNDYVTHAGGLSYNHRVGKSMLITRANLQYANLQTDQTFPFSSELNRSFVNVLPFVMWRYTIDRQNNLRVIYRTNTRKPSLAQLQEVVDNSNPIQLSIGNSMLDQQFQHSMFARLRRVNSEKGTVFFALIGGNVTQDYIGNSLYTSRSNNDIVLNNNLQSGSQITQNVNLSGYWDLRTFITYGMPIYPLKSNLNINLSGNFSNTPGLIDDELNNTQNSTYGVGLTLASNISEKIDFTLGSRSSYSLVNNDINIGQNTNFFNQLSSFKIAWVMPKDIVFRSDINNQFYSGLSDGFNESYWIWNMAIGRKVFKNKLGEINISVYDLLNQNLRINREVTANYIEDVRTNVLQRYVMVNFIYNFRNFGKMKEKEESRGERGFGRF